MVEILGRGADGAAEAAGPEQCEGEEGLCDEWVLVCVFKSKFSM